MTAEAIYKRTWWLNVLWMATVVANVLVSIPLMPAWFPEFLIGFVPVQTFNIWLRLQQNALKRRDRTETIREDWRSKKLGRMKEILMKGLRKGEPFYRLYRVLQTVFFLQLATPSAVTLWPWLSGRPADGDLFRLGFNLTAFATLLLSWNYVKASNRAAADALQREIDERE